MDACRNEAAMTSSDPASPPLLDTPLEGLMEWDNPLRTRFAYEQCRRDDEAARRLRHG
jgi:hypothetical protein